MSKGYLLLENGEVFTGQLFQGKEEIISGEAVFNTAMNGYQETITDPSYAGQILTFTYPSIGNYGFGDYGFESEYPALKAIVVKEIAEKTGHYECKWTFHEFIEKYQISCLSGIDTRKLTRILRIEGSMGAVISSHLDNKEELLQEARKANNILNTDLVSQVSSKEIKEYGQGNKTVVLWDFGCKKRIIDELVDRNCRVISVPASSSAELINSLNADAIVLSNGPGNPENCLYAVEEIKKTMNNYPMMGICLGHQLLALAGGAKTYKLKFGHRGANHTIKDLATGQCSITSQNHGYAVAQDSLENTDFKIGFINLNDQTIEGLYHKTLPLMSLQFHPEAAPGPQDTAYLFDEFLGMI